MPVTCRKRDGRWRIVKDDSGEIEKTSSDNPVDGGGHDSKKACSDQAAAINASLRDSVEYKGEDVDLTPTQEMAENAKQALDWREEYDRGMTDVGVERARQLINREELTPEIVRKMKSFFARHEVDKEAEGFNQGEDGFPSAGRIAWDGWGGDAGKEWAERKDAQLDEIEKESKSNVKSDEVKVGDFVEWDSSGGTANGRIDKIVKDGEIDVPDSSFTITGTSEDPAALITLYREGEPTDTKVGHRLSELRKAKEPKSNGDFFALRASVGQPRREQYMGREHLVVPTVMLVEGVLQSANSSQPELALQQEFGPSAPGWNGKPVVVNHPQKQGSLVSANSPDIWENEVIGQLFNSSVEDGKLKAEAWIDLDKAEGIGGKTAETVRRLENESMIEVSTGLFASVEPSSGEHAGQRYNGIWRGILPDHLALMEEGAVGACSIEDGCGAPRMNEQRCNCGPGCECEQPTVNSDTQVIPNEGLSDNDSSKDGKAHATMFRRALSTIGRLVGNRKMSDMDKRVAIEEALRQKKIDGFVTAVFDDGTAIVDEMTEDGPKMVRRSFDISNGVVSLGSKATPVRPETKFVDVRTNEEKTMDKAQLVQSLIDNEATPYTNDHHDTLMAFDEDTLKEMEPKSNDDGGSQDDNQGDGDAQTPHANQNGDTQVDFQTLLANADPETRESIEQGRQMFLEQKQNLVKTIMGCNRNQFTEEQLQKKDFSELKSIANLVADTEDYTARGGIRTQEKFEDTSIPAPKPIFGNAAE